MEIWVSVGRHRKETNWKNQKYTWPTFLEKLSRCQYTGETVSEYAAMSRDQQAVVKDVGGFVAGTIRGGRRKKGAITSRSMVTLDLDSAPADFWEMVTLDYSFAMALYSTHKHTPENPRLRLIIPLDREVLPDEYQAIARRLAAEIGMLYMDPTTFQVERLMYWPSMPKDGKFLYHAQEGDFLAADHVLGKYKDWTDSSQWPMHQSEGQRVHDNLKQAQDPTEKTGVVGAFCRVYGIEEAIAEYLPDVYTEAGDGRYTYTGGSTAAGLVVYNNLFAYSHHGTDPTSMQLCNAFDLVRLHKYGGLDQRCKEDTPISKLPSFKAMAELARKDKDVNLDIVKQQTDRAQEAFKDLPGAEPGESGIDAMEWLAELETDARGKIVGSIENILIVMRNDPNLAGRFGLNLFRSRGMVLGALPWNDSFKERPWVDFDDAGLRWYMEKTYQLSVVTKLYDGLGLMMQENSYHPVREFLENQVWDGVERIDTLFIDFLGAPDTEYTRTVTRKMMLGAVARIMQPGVKFDNVVVLVGPQGAGKSELISILGNRWAGESIGQLDSTKAMESLRGVWLMELAELSALKRAEVETVKHFISKKVDEYRPAYGLHLGVYPRQCIFIGSSNNREFINDPTGGRRFWPIEVQKSQHFLDLIYNKLPTLVGQLWAEAVAAWSEGEDLHLSPEIYAQAEAVQADHTSTDPWVEQISNYLEMPLPENWADLVLYDKKAYLRGDETQPRGTVKRDKVTAYEVWIECLGGDDKSLNFGISSRIRQAIESAGGWKRSAKKSRHHGGRVSHFFERVAN